jgi:TRAP-type mannitol/chloroaromatic compound transport system substrate-binding protein
MPGSREPSGNRKRRLSVRGGRAARVLLFICSLMLAAAGSALAQEKVADLRFSLWVPPAHPLTSAAKAWAEDIAKASGGAIKIAVFPSEQLGKAFDHYGVAWESLQDCTLSGRWRGHRERANARGHVFEGACRASLA